MAEEPPEQEEYDEIELGDINIPMGDANYFEKAQSFKEKIKELRIKYLGLKPKIKVTPQGAFRVYVRDKNRITGINKLGVIENIQFLEDRLGHHVVLTNWTEERMMLVMKQDMETWFYVCMRNREKWELEKARALELGSMINDILETAYRRGVGNKERESMTPTVGILERLGFKRQDEQLPMSPTEKLKKDMQQQY